MKLATLLLVLAITLPVVAKSHEVNDYPMTITITSVTYGGSFTHNCMMSAFDDAGGHYTISSNGICYTFAVGTKLRARRGSFMGMQTVEFLYKKGDKMHTSKYRIDSEW